MKTIHCLPILALIFLSGCLDSTPTAPEGTQIETVPVGFCSAQATEAIVLYGCPESLANITFTSSTSKSVAPTLDKNLTGYFLQMTTTGQPTAQVEVRFAEDTVLAESYLGVWGARGDALLEDLEARETHSFFISTCKLNPLDLTAQITAEQGTVEIAIWEFIDEGYRIEVDGKPIEPTCSGKTSHRGLMDRVSIRS